MVVCTIEMIRNLLRSIAFYFQVCGVSPYVSTIVYSYDAHVVNCKNSNVIVCLPHFYVHEQQPDHMIQPLVSKRNACEQRERERERARKRKKSKVSEGKAASKSHMKTTIANCECGSDCILYENSLGCM